MWKFDDYDDERVNQLYDSYKIDFPEKLKIKTPFDWSYENAKKQYERGQDD